MNALALPTFELEGQQVFVAGHRGMVGAAIARRLKAEGCKILVADHRELDLTQQRTTESFLREQKPDVVIVAAAKVGGIVANESLPVDFLSDNLCIASNVINGSYRAGVRKLLFLGSSCIFPREAPQPMTEEGLLTGPLEPTNEWYAIAKIAGIKLCQAYRRQYGADFVSVMPTNVYGPGDNYHPRYSHVSAGLIRRMHEAKLQGAPSVTVWGTGTPRREFLFVDDLADACVFVLKHYSGEGFLNVGTGEDLSIADFAREVADVVGFKGQLIFDTTKPDGPERKLLDVSKLSALGWSASTVLGSGLRATYEAFLASRGKYRGSEVGSHPDPNCIS